MKAVSQAREIPCGERMSPISAAASTRQGEKKSDPESLDVRGAPVVGREKLPAAFDREIGERLVAGQDGRAL